jgi:hypothetical protein
VLSSWQAGHCPLSTARLCSSIYPLNLTEKDHDETGYNYLLPKRQAARWCVRAERLSAILHGGDHCTPHPLID